MFFLLCFLFCSSLVRCEFSPSNSSLNSVSTDRFLVGNVSQSFTFQVAPPSVKVTYLGLNGYSLYIMAVGFSNKSKFTYDEEKNRLTIISLDASTVGHYSAVDNNWKTFNTIITAINVSSLEIHNSRVSEEKLSSSLVWCSVSIIRSTFKESELNFNSLQRSKTNEIENFPRLNLFLSTRSTEMNNDKFFNDTNEGQNFTRMIFLQRRLTRADHNGTIRCQIESNLNGDIFLTQTQSIDIQYGPNLEVGASNKVSLESEVLKLIAMECQIESNPIASFVWYEMSSHISMETIPNFGQRTSIDQYSSSQSSVASRSVFGTTRQIQRIYQYPGEYSMQCQAQANGKTVLQEFFIRVHPQSNALRTDPNLHPIEQKSNKIPLIIGIIIGMILLLLVVAIVIAALVYLQRRKGKDDGKDSNADKTSIDKTTKSRWGSLPIDYSNFAHDPSKVDSSSTSHLVESAETTSIPSRPSPLMSTNSSYRQTPSTLVSLSYRQASALPGFRPLAPSSNYSNEHNDTDEGNTNIIVMPSSINRSRMTTPFGSHKSLSESIQSLRSNQLALPMKKRLQDLPKREEINSSPKLTNDYQHHHYQNPTELQVEKRKKNTSSEEDEEQSHPMAQPTNRPNSSEYNEVEFRPSSDRSIVVDPIKEKHPDELPPPYASYAYREPTEV